MSQIGFININLTKSSDPEMERRSPRMSRLRQQLGRVIEVLEALLANSATTGWSADQNKALGDFFEMAKEIAAVKGDYIAPTKVNVDRFLEESGNSRRRMKGVPRDCRTIEEGIADLKNP